MLTRIELEAAYRATCYRVLLPEACCDLRIAKILKTWSDWLERAGAVTFAILTSDNPASEQLSEADNAVRRTALQADLLALAWRFLPAENRPDVADWPVEPGFCVIDIPLAEATRLGRQYGQNAIVFGGCDGRPQLHWIKEETK
jgi:hypothetical protein